MNARADNIKAVEEFIRKTLARNPDGVPPYAFYDLVQDVFICTPELAQDYVTAAMRRVATEKAPDGVRLAGHVSIPSEEDRTVFKKVVADEVALFHPEACPIYCIKQRFFKARQIRDTRVFNLLMDELDTSLYSRTDLSVSRK